MPLSERTLDRVFAVVIALLLAYFFIFEQIRITWTDYWLTRDAQQGVAAITKVLWTGHSGVAYRYRVNQREYRGEEAVDRGKNLGYVGESVVVYFSSSHPWLSRLRFPRSVMPGGLPVILLAWFFMVLFIITAIDPDNKWALKSRNKAKPQDSQ